MADKVVQVRAARAVGTLIRQAMTVGGVVIPRVHDWWIIAPGIETSLPQFTTTRDTDFAPANTPFIHGYCVGIGDLPRQHEASELKFKDPFTLNVWGLYEWRLGTDDKNAEHIFVEHLAAIQDKLSRAPRLQTDGNFYGGMDGVSSHGQLTFDALDPLGFGNKKVFLARGSITVGAIVQLTNVNT